MAEKFYITTAIDYVNGAPHLGHALEKVQADVIARYRRLVGDEVFFLTGTDEHGATNVRGAKKAGVPVKEFIEKNSAAFRLFKETLNLSWDDFIRTSDRERHWPGAELMWQKLVAAGDIYKKKYRGLYCVGHEAFITEKELVDGKCPEHLTEPEVVEEENYFFKLSKYSQQIEEKIKSDELQILPESRKNEILSLIAHEGLQDVSFSRPKSDSLLGVPVPGDDTQVMYVWCDALANYLSAIGFGRNDDWQKLWPADVHVIGKSILRFHAAIWPGMLLSAGLPLPKTLFVHGFINSAGHKMSKTIGNIVDPFELVKKYGTDAVRFWLLHDVPTFGDADFTEERFKESYNAHLANGLGNLVARLMALAAVYLSEPISQPKQGGFPQEYTDALEAHDLQRGIAFVWSRVAVLDQKIAETEPFKLLKDNSEKGRALLVELLNELYWIGRMLNPFLPEANVLIKKTILENKKPSTLFPRV